ncbi:AgmX/PglI C-terminal domain-containing protein [Polyangium sp. y55x31]|uniref:AgmX/PglI C-terminal domain-containing protein n=1 Tax=Polyangium sp. y55x31 TaxID=3042688 RepID=UPI0024827DF5|nr:AgmX/PglI C-terminal domain-containing protein [Polyangium sp. y55x31]MDI1479850.1 AgmX/PglI C-terminal domain-containing protein [Polyangium sp. y55x31]
MRRHRPLVAAHTLALVAGLSGCLAAPGEVDGEQALPAATRGAPAILETAAGIREDDFLQDENEFTTLVAPRGFGTITGRLPGTSTVVPGVRLRAHSVRVTIRDGFARTEIEEELANDTPTVLEGRYVFPLPPDASLSRLALWVGDELVEGEMVERDRAARIFQGIVDDTVRPRDPALLEWTQNSSFSLKIFPMPARGSRKVILAYDEVLPVTKGVARYTYPLSLGEDRAVRMDSFRVHVTVEDAGGAAAEAKVLGHAASLRTEAGRLEADFQADSFVPNADFVLEFPRPQAEILPVAVESGGDGRGFFAVRVPVPTAPEASSIEPRNEKVFVLDASHGVTREGLSAEVTVAETMLRRLREGERFAVLLCDSACVSYPERGLSAKSDTSLADASRFLHERAPQGASDLASALVSAISRIETQGRGQVVYLGDGAPSAGELKVDSIAARVRPVLSDKQAELRLVGAGPSIDELVLGGLAEELSASYERLAAGSGSLAQRALGLAKGLDVPLLVNARLTLPAGFADVFPRKIPAVRAGEEIVLVGRLSGAPSAESATVELAGEFDGMHVLEARTLSFSAAPGADRKVIARRWATERIGELGRRADDDAAKETVSLSQQYHVQSRLTSLLVLENDRMFAAFGIPRTQGKNGLSSEVETGLGHLGRAPSDAIGDSFGAGGLGLSGVGEGGGGTGQGFGSGHGRLGSIGTGTAEMGSHASRSVPSVRMGATTVSGRMPPEVIQRIVRQNFGRFRLCYENGLRSNPTLTGRVAVRFVIGRDGSVVSVANGGSDLPNADVVNCVIRGFQGLSFPQPEVGTITVVYPVLFSPDGGGTRSSRPWGLSRHWGGSSSWIGKADEAWRSAGKDTLEKLEKSSLESPESRRAREAWVTGLLARGRFEEALREASKYVELDPDRARAHELHAEAAAALGEDDTALVALDTQVELDPSNASAHKRAARAFEASGDERRACAHFRSYAELRPFDQDGAYEALRCRARVLGEREAVLAALAAQKNPSKRLVSLREALEKGEAPAYAAGDPGGERISVKLTCGEGVEGCPRVVVIDPAGRVTTPIVPGTGRSGASWVTANASGGTYRVLVTGGLPAAKGELVVRLDDTIKKFDVRGGEGARTAAVVSVDL